MNPEVLQLLKLVLIFGVIIVLLAFKRPLNLVMTITSILTIVLYQMPMDAALPAIKEGILGKNTINAILVLYCITFLQRMMEARKQLSGCQEAMNGLFNNRRINASVVPFMLGCLPAASTVILCGPIVREAIGDNLSTEEKAACTSYFRHISEAFLPTYTNIIIALSLTNGLVTPGQFVLFMLPIVAILFLTGWIVYLRRVPKDTGMVPDKTKGEYGKQLVASIWPIFLAIAMILIFSKLPVWGAVLICIVLNFFVNKFTPQEVTPYFKSAFEGKLILNTFAVMTFGKLLAATGVVNLLPQYFGLLPIPSFMVYALIFFFGTMVAGSQAITVLCMPMAIASVGGASFLSLFILIMSMSYIVMQITPTHICLTLCAEDYKIPLGSLIVKVVPMVAVATVFTFGYYFILQAVGL